MLSRRDAKKIIEKCKEIEQELTLSSDLISTYQSEIIDASNKLKGVFVTKELRTIPVEELNKEKKGIRVKTLRSAGYETIADVQSASVWQLEAVNGISENTANLIKTISNRIINEVSESCRIRLSADDQSPEATRLIEAITKYNKFLKVQKEYGELLEYYRNNIPRYLEGMSAKSSMIKWLFLSKSRKAEIQEEYDALTQIMESGFESRYESALKEHREIEWIDRESAWSDFSIHSVRYSNVLEALNPGVLGSFDENNNLPEDLAREIQDQCFFPDGLLCELRKYQEFGVKYILHQEKVLLGDEMGLGKTVQAIATMVSLKNTGEDHFMVICPASVLANWCREVTKMSKLSVIKIHGSDAVSSFNEWEEVGGVGVTTYETTAKLQPEKRMGIIVVDEAHYVKNPMAIRSNNVRRLCEFADRILFMTGTALENNVDEMITLINVLQPHVAEKLDPIKHMSRALEFKKTIAPVYYRRRREDVLTELPELIINEEWCIMTPQEERVYEDAVLGKRYADARRVSWNAYSLEDSSKARRLKELVEEAESEGRKVIVFSFFLDTISRIREFLGEKCSEPINGSVSPQRRQEIIDEFDQSPEGSVLLAQIQAGGTGLNIQSASVVILCEPQFKPSIENQAISRAYRMGQTRNVLVYRLLCEDTVDEKLMKVISEKQQIFDAFADESVAAQQEISATKFSDIIDEEIERIKKKNEIQ